jgi:hypothetical protein
MGGALIIGTIGGGILVGIIGVLVSGSLTITIHGTDHGITHGTTRIVSMAVIPIMATLIMDTIVT